MAVLSVNDLHLADRFFDLIQKPKNSQSDPDKSMFFGEKLAKVASKNVKFAKVVLISAKGLRTAKRAKIAKKKQTLASSFQENATRNSTFLRDS